MANSGDWGSPADFIKSTIARLERNIEKLADGHDEKEKEVADLRADVADLKGKMRLIWAGLGLIGTTIGGIVVNLLSGGG